LLRVVVPGVGTRIHMKHNGKQPTIRLRYVVTRILYAHVAIRARHGVESDTVDYKNASAHLARCGA